MNKRYNVLDFKISDLKELIYNGDDTHDNQIRVTKNGIVYLSQDIVAAEQIDGLAFRFETFDAYNGYVGKSASEDDKYIKRLYNAIINNWNDNHGETYIDVW